MSEFEKPGMDDPMAQSDPTVQEQTDNRNSNLQMRDRYREHASELQNNVAEIQAARYQNALYQLMMRSGDNPELINAMNAFTMALEHRAMYGDSEQLLHPGYVEKLANFFQEAGERLSPRNNSLS